MNGIFKSIMAAVTFSVVTFSLGYVFFYLGPIYETKFMPVFKDTSAAIIEVDKKQDLVHVAVTGQKDRPCEWKGIVALVERHGVWTEGTLVLKDPRGSQLPPNTPSVTRPVGKQHLGEAFISPIGDRVQVYFQHRCHPMWQTQTLLYELDMSQRPAQVK